MRRAGFARDFVEAGERVGERGERSLRASQFGEHGLELFAAGRGCAIEQRQVGADEADDALRRACSTLAGGGQAVVGGAQRSLERGELRGRQQGRAPGGFSRGELCSGAVGGVAWR